MEEIIKELKEKGYSEAKVKKWLENPNVKKIYKAEDLEAAKLILLGGYVEEVIEEDDDDLELVVEEMTKDELDEYAINTFGIDLDKRFTKENMIDELTEKLKEQE